MNKFKNYIIEAFILILLFLIGFSWFGSVQNRKIERLKENLEASMDTVAVLKLKNGDYLYEKKMYELREKELEEYLDISKEEIKDIKKKLASSLETIAKLKSSVRIDTVKVDVVRDSIIYYNECYYHGSFYNRDKWISFDGSVTINKEDARVDIYDIDVPVPLVLGQTKDGQFFVTSENPYFSVTDIDAASIKKSKQRFSLGVYAGLGVYYGLTSKQVDIGPGGGVGFFWNF